MPNALQYDLQNLGFLARSGRLRELGHPRSMIDGAIRDGWLHRPVRPWLATTAASRDAIIAVLHRGVLTDASALGERGVWRGLDRSIHVLVPPNYPATKSNSRVELGRYAQPKHATSGVVRHWGRDRAPATDDPDWMVSTIEALSSFGRSHSRDDFVAAVDSALHENQLRHSELRSLASALPKALRAALDDVNSKAEAGTESLARQRLRPLVHSIDIQVWIGKHRVDLLIDGWLVIEIDSEEWHSGTRADDLRRDVWLTTKGYRVLRFDYVQVMHEWHACEAAVMEELRFPPQRRPRASNR